MEQYNIRLLSKEDSKKLFKDNCLRMVQGKDFFENDEEFIEQLFNLKNIFVTNPFVYVYNNNNEFIEAKTVISKMFSSNEKILEFLSDEKCLCYIHSTFLQKDIHNRNIHWLRYFKLNLEN